MHRILLVTVIIFVSLVSTACVNKFAIQELNNNAKQLISQGNVDGAIARLESSIDLDDTVFETHYNLAVAYIQAKKYDKAIDSLNKTLELNPDFADAYYSLAVVNEEKGYDIITGENIEETEVDSDNDGLSKRQLTNDDKTEICKYFTDAIDYYNKYLSKKTKAEDKDAVNQKILKLNDELLNYSTEVPAE